MNNSNIADQIMSIINQMAEKLGVAAEKVYPVLIKQAYVEGVKDIIWIFFGICLTSIGVYFAGNAIRNKSNSDQEIVIFTNICLIIIGLVFTIITINDAITAFVNPDWYVFNTLLKQLIQ